MESFDYIDSSIHVPQARKFKYSDFIISKKMGKGQFGEVLLVRHKETGWLCGLKVMEKK
jgi:aurora kinase